MLSLEKPEIFTPKFEIVSCFVEYQDEILLLLRQDHKPQPNTYGVPAGKVDQGIDKDINEAMTREGREETQLDLSNAEYLMKTYVQYPGYDFIYHMYRKQFQEKPDVIINPEEHKGFSREKISNALQKDLIQDLDECIKLIYHKEKNTKTLECKGLNYEAKRELLEEYEDELLEQLKDIKHGNALISLIREILKNSADHTDENIDITLHLEPQGDQMKVRFSIYDDGPGIAENTPREKKGKYNFGIGRGMITAAAETFQIDLVLHNNGKIEHLNDLELQKHVAPSKKFGYQGIGFFEIEK